MGDRQPTHQYVAALAESREHLHAARGAFSDVGRDGSLPASLRVQALVNLGNSYDILGRDLEAMAAWREALDIAPDFGMAHGNIGIALAGIASFARQHRATLACAAARALDRALADDESVLAIGGPGSLKHFRETRDRLPVDPPAPPEPTIWSDPHLRWVHEKELFLHVSPSCQRETDETLDPLVFEGLFESADAADQNRITLLCDAFNVLKREFVTARYLTWLVTDPDAPGRPEMDAATRRASWVDTLHMARWGVRTGVGVNAFTAATNLLDKVAGLTHIYFATGRQSGQVYFRGFWHQRNKPNRWQAEFAEALEPPGFNRGLIALSDLACDLEQESALSVLLDRRHTATHRFLVAHDQLFDAPSDEWLQREEWGDIVEGTLEALHTARAAIIYLVRMVDTAEAGKIRVAKQEGIVPDLPLLGVNPDLNEIA